MRQYFSTWTWAHDILNAHFQGDESKITGPMLIAGNRVIEGFLIDLKNGRQLDAVTYNDFRNLIVRKVIAETTKDGEA